MAYLAYHFNVIPHQPGSEILIALIADFGFDTFDYSEVGFIGYINEELSTNLNFTDLKFDDFIYSYQIEKIKTINWNAEWEQNFDPVLVDDLLFIRAPFHEKNLCPNRRSSLQRLHAACRTRNSPAPQRDLHPHR